RTDWGIFCRFSCRRRSPMNVRRAKLVCTLGPACDGEEGLRALIEAGMDVARFNFSHGTHEQHLTRLQRLRAVSDQAKKAVAALQDLCGPKIRAGSFASTFSLPQDREVVLVEAESSADEATIPIPYQGLAGDVRVGDRIMFDDGRVHVRCTSIEGDKIRAIVTQ